MGLRQFETSLETLGKEVIENVKNPENAILLITGTEDEKGVIIRMYCNNPHKVAGILYSKAIDTGDFKTVNEMIKALRLIALTAEALIEKELRKRDRSN
jgi:hypothetical protein